MSDIGKTAISAYLPMSEANLLLLLFLTEPRHGYAIMHMAQDETNGRVVLSSSTVYTILYKMEQDGLIEVVSEVDRRKVYCITELGTEVLEAEMERLNALLRLAVNVTNKAQNTGHRKGENTGC